ncbi:hypothetical protein D3C80_1465500 [compost metagenome]
MVEVHMCQEHIRNIFRAVAFRFDRGQQACIAMQVIMPEKFLVLLVPYTGIDQDQSAVSLNQHTTHGPATQVIFICRVQFVPQTFRYYTVHGTTVQFE